MAAHLEPEILIVDEVLAVGDAAFQRKCLGKMEDVSRQQGRTVLFVSHNLLAVRSLCSVGIVLDAGTLQGFCSAEEALSLYAGSVERVDHVEFAVDPGRPSISFLRLDGDELKNGNLIIDIGFKSPFPLRPPVAGIVVSSASGSPVYGSNLRFHKTEVPEEGIAQGVARITVTALPIHAGSYRLSVWLGDWQVDYEERRDVLAFTFKDGTPPPNTPSLEIIGFTDAEATWSLVSLNN